MQARLGERQLALDGGRTSELVGQCLQRCALGVPAQHAHGLERELKAALHGHVSVIVRAMRPFRAS